MPWPEARTLTDRQTMATRDPRQTRQRLLRTAFEEIHAHGFQGMRVDEVLRRSGLKKGAFYHHFGSKTELAYAVLEEQVRPLVESIWVEPLARDDDPVRVMLGMLDDLDERVPPSMLEHGCPLNNLAQEMAALDQGFRARIAGFFAAWIDKVADLFERGKAAGFIRGDVDSLAVARFLVAVLEGCVGLFKAQREPRQWHACRSQLAAYLAALRPAAPPPRSPQPTLRLR
jgi:TetR/AcrR family transcriptional repressor of nem operon